MKLKNFWKRFWTLDRHTSAGFTLVELIVVIAILAILAGVGIPVYSGYITRANKQADMTLISEVKNALTLARYSGTLEDGSNFYIILSADKAYTSADTGDNVALDNALKATFGENYALQLKHDDWKVDSEVLLAAKHDYADAVAGSSYIDKIGTDKVISDVQNCSTKLAELLVKIGGEWAGDSGAAKLDELLGSEGIITDLLAAGQYSGDDITAEVLANATVFGVAGSIDNNERENISNNFNGGFYLLRNHPSFAGRFDPISTDNIVDVAHTYAALEALVGYINNPTTNEIFADIDMTSNKPVEIVNSIQNAGEEIVTLAMQPNSPISEKVCEYYGVDNLNDILANPATSSPAMQDGKAYTAIMQTVNDLRQDYVKDLDTAELFTTGGVSDRVNDFVTAVSLNSFLTGTDGDGHEALRALAANADSSAVIIAFMINENGEFCGVIPTAADSEKN